ncbi:MAG: glycosyltransferase [Pyrinomonadaceae bacterium]
MSESNAKSVFYDPSRRRWRRVSRTSLVLAALVSLGVAAFVSSVLVNPLLPQLSLRALDNLPHAADARPQLPLPPAVTHREVKARRAEAALRRALETTRVVPGVRPALMKIAPVSAQKPPDAPGAAHARPLAIGFYVNWDDSSYDSLKRNLAQLDWVVPEWSRLQAGDDPLRRDVDPRALDLIRRERPQTQIVPLVQNSEGGVWNSKLLAAMIGDAATRQKLIDALSQFVAQNNFAGVCIDFEEVPSAQQANLLRFMQELHTAFSPRGWTVAQAAPFDDEEWDYRAYGAATDRLLLMAYDEHWQTGPAGAIAAQGWFETTLAKRLNDLDPAKTIICFGGYGYDWSRGEETKELTFQEAILTSHDNETDVTLDPATRNPTYSFEDENGVAHTVWFLDAVTAYNQLRAAAAFHPAGFALWRLGSEDPSLWSFFGVDAGASSLPPAGLRQIKYGYDVDYEGEGEILDVVAQPHEGARDVTVEPSSGMITGETFTSLPSTYVVQRTREQPGLVALTFDDGPDAEWTPAILDVLKREQVPATFFIIGQNGQNNPGLVRRIVAEGHDIGNHTFTHPNLGEIPGRVADLELTATERLIESLTGRSTILFRPPYFGDAEPNTPAQVEPVVRAKGLGYLTVGLRVDPDDWKQPGVDEIVKRTIEGLENPDPDKRGQVVLLHDSGGDRSQTIAALPVLIEKLRARGYRFVTVSQLAGLTRDQAMPPISARQGAVARADAVGFYAISLLGWLLHWLFLVGILLGVARVVVIGALALAQRLRARWRETTRAGESYRPFVSVIVPAYNEEKVIAQTVESLLASDYEAMEIIVVDDGSPDGTSEVVRERFAGEPRVQLFTKENGGKAAALNYGLRRSRGEVIIALDADTVFAPETVGALAHRFFDPQTGAVAGNAKVGNRINLVTRWQALEYITAQNMDRRAFASLNCITVVPGAVGAWRRDLLDRVGGFTSDTLAEDQDLTLNIRRLGYKIGYEEHAVAWTEAPDTLRTLAKQRFRWSFGTLQCMWKHKDALLRPRYGTLGFVAMPNVWVFQILFPLVSPIMDLMLIWSFVSALVEREMHTEEYAITNLRQILFYYALFLAVDWLAAALAFALERREQWSLLWWLFLQRFCYRQVMYYVMVKSLGVAMHGKIVGWGKLERKATMEARSS